MIKKLTCDQHLVSLPWSDYELLDSGENMKLERFGDIVVARPETQALWQKMRPELWETAHAEFAFHEKKGLWDMKKSVPESWGLSWNTARFLVRLTGFKHTGVFPEQAPNWQWLDTHVRDVVRPTSDVGRTTSYIPQVLNLFGYTGIASLVASTSRCIRHPCRCIETIARLGARKRATLDYPRGCYSLGTGRCAAFVKREVRMWCEI